MHIGSEERSGVVAMCEQRNSNELQSRSAEVEAMEMNFEQGVAGAVAKAECADFDKRSTCEKCDAQDEASSHAKQVVFVLVINGVKKPQPDLITQAGY
jgi:hypothetical protein